MHDKDWPEALAVAARKITRVIAIGECMVEMAPQDDGTHNRGFAGDTFNTAWHLKRLDLTGVSVDYLSAVGDDALSAQMVAFMEAAGIGTGHLRRIEGASVGLYVITLIGGERVFSYWRSASAARRLADGLGALDGVGKETLVYVSGITLAILPPEGRATLKERLRRCRRAGATVAFDPNIRPRLWEDAAILRAETEDAAACADVVFPSHEDEAAIFGDTDPVATAARYLDLGSAVCIVKDGPGPVSVVMAGHDITRIDVEALPSPVDTTGAGDAFNASVLASWIAGRNLSESVRRGCGTASLVVMQSGALVHPVACV